MRSLTGSALAGVAWNGAGSFVLIATQIASTATTARLVAPAEFGAYATAQAAAGIAGYFTLNAIGGGIQRRARLGPRTIGTAIVLSLAAGTLVASLVWVAADPWASAWDVPAAAPIVRVIAITLFLIAAATIPVALLRRQLRFGAAAIVETGAQVVGAGVGVALAIQLHSAFALAAGQAAGAAVLLCASAALVRKDLRIAFAADDARELIVFASQVGALGLGSYVAYTAPSWFIARAFGVVTLGLYSRANLIVTLPLTYIASSITKVLFPLYGRFRNDVARTRMLLDEGLSLTTGLIWPLFALLAAWSPVVVRVLLGENWDGAAPLVALLALFACANLPTGLLTNAAEAFGWMRLLVGRQAVFFAGIGVTLAVVHYARLSPNALVVGLAVTQWVTFLVTLTPFVRRGLLDGRSVARAHGAHAAVSVAAFAIGATSLRLVEGAPLAVQAMCFATLACAVLIALLLGRAWYPASRVLATRVTMIVPRAADAAAFHTRAAR